MLPTGKRDAPRELKPGDLYVVTSQTPHVPTIKIGSIINSPADNMFMKFVFRHSCGAMEFLILPPNKLQYATDSGIPACQDIST